jgi:VCBS repeat-containing protein
MDNDLIFGTETSDMLTGAGAGDTQLAAVTSAAEPFDDALPQPLDAAQVVIPQGENVVREPVTPGEVVELPFPADSQFLARIDNGNLAIKVGDVTIILQGYVEAAGQTPPVIEAADGKPLDIATILASTDPNIDIQTAAGPAAGAQGQGADNTGAILAPFGEGAGLGGFQGAGALDATDGLGGGTVDQTGTLFKLFGLAPIDTAPVTQDDAYKTNEDTVLNIAAPGVLANDTDPDGDPLTATLLTGPAHGTLTVNADGSFTYTPDANYNGPDSFTYQADDGKGGTTPATVNITVDPVNDAPVAVNDSYTTDEDTPLVVGAANSVLNNDTDVDGDPLTASIVTGPAHGTLTLNADGTFTYTPAANYHGPDSFTYQADDGNGGTNTATVNLTVNPVNDAPVAANDSYTTDEDTPLTIVAPGILNNDTDVDGDTLTESVVTGPAHGTLTINADGSFTYTPDANYNGPDSFTYKANDGTVDSNVATVSINVTPVNDAPVAADDSYTTNEDTPLTIAVPGVLNNDTDVEGDPLTAVLVTGPAHGTLAINADGSFTYTPDANYNGPDSFTYAADDGKGGTSNATVNLTVNPVNDAPVATDDSYTTNEDTPLTIVAPGILNNDTDVDGDTLTASLVTGPAHGTLAINPDGSFTYTPNKDYNGPDSFTYKANDGTVDGNVATVSINVNPVNDAPQFAGGLVFAGIPEDANSHATLNWIIKDVDDPAGPFTVTVKDASALPTGVTYDPATETFTLNANGNYDYLAAGETEVFNITMVIADPHGATTEKDFTLVIGGDADAPDAVADTVLTNVGVASGFAVPDWALVVHDKDASTEHVTGATSIGGDIAVHLPGGVLYQEDGTLGGSFKYQETDASEATVTVHNQAGGDIIGTAAAEILIGTASAEKLDGKGGDDIIFAGPGDEAFGREGNDVLFFGGDATTKLHGGTDGIAVDGGLTRTTIDGDVLATSTSLRLDDAASAANYDGIETISMQDRLGGTGAQSLTLAAGAVQQLSDHTITPGGIFTSDKDAVRIDGDAVDQLYLSISKDGAGTGWADTGVVANGYHIFAHETTAGDATTTDAYAMVSTAIPAANVHLNADAP